MAKTISSQSANLRHLNINLTPGPTLQASDVSNETENTEMPRRAIRAVN